MVKSTNFGGTSVFGQLISFLPKSAISEIVEQSKSDRYTKQFRTWDHLVTMLFAVLTHSSGLREIESGLAGFRTKLLHLGLRHVAKRSTLSDANRRRSADVFEAIFQATYDRMRPFLSDSCPKNQRWMQRLFLVDSTTITLFKNILKACGTNPANGKRKGGVKINVGMHLSEGTPSLVRITSAATSDSKFMEKFKSLDPGTIVVFDKAYVNFTIYNHWTQTEVIFVSRRHRHQVINVEAELPLSPEERKAGVVKQTKVYLGHSKQKQRVLCRLIDYVDPTTGRTLQFVTNDFLMQPSQIADIYKQRWQIELLFKRLKQNLQLSDFIGDNENAIRIQIWCNLIADLLLTRIRKGLNKQKAYSNVAALVRIHLMNYVALKQLILNPGDPTIFRNNSPNTQLKFDYTPSG